MILVVVQNKAEVWAYIFGSGLLTGLEFKHAWSLVEKVTREALVLYLDERQMVDQKDISTG